MISLTLLILSLVAQTDIPGRVLDSPLGDTAIGVAFLIVLGAIGFAARWYLVNVSKPESEQRIKRDQALMESEIELRRDLRDSIRLIGETLVRVNDRLTRQSERLDRVLEALAARVVGEDSGELPAA